MEVTYMKMEERDRLIREEGREQVMDVLIESYQELGITRKDAVERLCQKFSILKELAMEYIHKYWEV